MHLGLSIAWLFIVHVEGYCTRVGLIHSKVASEGRVLADEFSFKHHRTSRIFEDWIMHKKVNLSEKLEQFSERWSPRTVAQFNGHDVMVVKVKGEFVWHQHDDTDDFFLVLDGELAISLPAEEEVTLRAGDLYIVPRGIQHRPYAKEETHLLLIEPSGTPNTGDVNTAALRKFI